MFYINKYMAQTVKTTPRSLQPRRVDINDIIQFLDSKLSKCESGGKIYEILFPKEFKYIDSKENRNVIIHAFQSVGWHNVTIKLAVFGYPDLGLKLILEQPPFLSTIAQN